MNPHRPMPSNRHYLATLAVAAAFGASVGLAQGPPPSYVVIDPAAPGDAGQQIQDCADNLPTGGGVCDARGQRGGDIAVPVQLDEDNVRVILAAGMYNVTGAGAFVISKDNVTLEGQGPATRITATTWSGVNPIIDVTNANNPVLNTQLRDFQVTGKTNVPAQLIRFLNVEGSRATGLILEDGGQSGILVRDAKNVDLANNTIRNMDSNGIRLDRAVRYARVRGNFIEDVGDVDNTAGIMMWGLVGEAPQFVRITDNSIVNAANGIRAAALQGGTPSDFLIAGNTVASSGLDPSTSSSQGEGIASSGKNVQIIANRVEESRQAGILIFGDTAENVSMVGNTVSNSSQLNTTDHDAISLDTRGSANDIKQVLVAGNVAFDDQTTQTQNHLIGSALTSGGSVLGTIDDLLVASNVGSGFGTQAIQCELEPLAAQTRNIPE